MIEKKLYPDELASKFTQGELYRPSNGTEGMMFQEIYCDICERDKDWRENEKNPCLILSNSLAFDEDNPEYPKEWCYNEHGQPCCAAFIKEGTYIPDKNQLDLFNGK